MKVSDTLLRNAVMAGDDAYQLLQGTLFITVGLWKRRVSQLV